MSFYRYLTRALVVTFVALFLVPEISARELRLDRSITSGLRHKNWQKDLPEGLVFIFSSDKKAVYANISDPVQLSDFARTTVMHFSQNLKRDDGVTCDEAFRSVLTRAAVLAVKGNANAVVNIQSKFLEENYDSKSKYTCNSGTGSATVDLIVQFAQLSDVELARARVDYSQLAKVPDGALERISLPATRVNDLADADSIPFIKGNCKSIYKDKWLNAESPRAFAIGPSGACGFSWGYAPPRPGASTDPAVRALEACAGKTNLECQLYAIDNDVVFVGK
jgi:hypothetical protein